jgi:hypothetical protein
MRTININTFYQYVNWLAAKNISGGNIPPDIFNIAVPICVNQMVRKYYGVPEQYQPGMPMPQVAYEITQLVTDYMSQLKQEVVLAIDRTGQAKKPSDYLHKSSMSATWIEVLPTTVGDNAVEGECCNCKKTKECCTCDNSPTLQTKKKNLTKNYLDVQWIPVTVVSDNERWAYLQSSLRRPTKEYPICTFLGNDVIQFYPADMRSAKLTYIRYPITAKWAYILDPDGYPLYDPANSINIEFPEICADEMAVTLLNRVGISIREMGLSEWANFNKKSGL